MITLNVLGGVDLQGGEGQDLTDVLAQPKRLALLVYLCMASGRPYLTRDELCGMFWPDLDPGRARAALSQSLYFLRTQLGSDFLITRGKEEVGVRADALACDALEFARARQADNCPHMLELYRGDFLAGLYLVNTAEWEGWVADERKRCRQWAAAAAWAQAEEAAGSDAGLAANYGLRALDLAGDDELYLRKLMALLDSLGDRAGIARVFRDYVGRLEREYGLDVAPETRALFERLTARQAEIAVPGAGGKGPPSADPALDSRGHPDSSSRRVGAGNRKVAWAGAAALLAVFAWFLLRGQEVQDHGGAGAVRAVRLVVHPFADPGSDADINYVGPGVRRELVRRLASINRLLVNMPEAGDALPGTLNALPEPSGESPAAYSLKGELRTGPQGLVITLHLSGGNGIGTSRTRDFELQLHDFREVSADMAVWVGQLLAPGITQGELARIRAGLTTSPEAHRLYLRGRHQMSTGNADAFHAARVLFEQALALDPQFARAWSGLADAYTGQVWARKLSPETAIPRAREAAERSLELDPALAEAHVSLATILNRHYWDTAGAERHFREAIRLNPRHAETRLQFSALLRNTGRFEEARSEAKAALELDPLSFYTHFELVVLDLMEERLESAIRRCRQLIEADPNAPMARFLLARSLAESGDYPGALAALEEMGTRAERPPALTLKGYIHARSGRSAEAGEVLEALEAAAERTPGMPVRFDLAVVHLGMGDRQQALELFERALEERDARVRLLAHEPMFRKLRDEPVFHDLIRRAGLPLPQD